MKADPNFSALMGFGNETYDKYMYTGMSGYVMHRNHALLEQAFSKEDVFENVIEFGAGTGKHLEFVRHQFQYYLMADMEESALEYGQKSIKDPRISWRIIDSANAIPLPDASFDRIIASHVLEHLSNPVAVLREWTRILKPGGMMSIALPCDPGLLWRMGRCYNISTKKQNPEEFKLAVALEHINAINNLITIIRYYFENFKEQWWPLRIQSIDFNLLYIVHIINNC